MPWYSRAIGIVQYYSLLPTPYITAQVMEGSCLTIVVVFLLVIEYRSTPFQDERIIHSCSSKARMDGVVDTSIRKAVQM